MPENVSYIHTGKLIRFQGGNLPDTFGYQASDKWLVLGLEDWTSLKFRAINLESIQGEVDLNRESSISTVSVNVPPGWTNPVFRIDGDTVIAATKTKGSDMTRIALVRLDTGTQSEEYDMVRNLTIPVGIDGDTLYLDIAGISIEGVNLKTWARIFFTEMIDGSAHPEVTHENLPTRHLGRTYDGKRAIVNKFFNYNTGEVISEVASVPDRQVYLRISGDVVKYKITEDGIFYKLAGGKEYYYSSFYGQEYLVKLDHKHVSFSGTYTREEVNVSAPSIAAVSNDGNSIWVEYRSNYGRVYLVNYERVCHYQKSATSAIELCSSPV